MMRLVELKHGVVRGCERQGSACVFLTVLVLGAERAEQEGDGAGVVGGVAIGASVDRSGIVQYSNLICGVSHIQKL